jgi:transcriptional regulator with XRE-family HTH domain
MIIFISVVIPQLDFNIFKLKCQQLKLNFLKFFVDLSNRTVYNMDIRTKQKGSDNMKQEEILALAKNITTATRLRIAMERKNITAKELSVKSGVSEPSISQYVHGIFAPKNITAGKLADALNVDPMWLMGFDVEMLPQKTRIEHFDYFVEGATDIAGTIPEYDERGHKIQELFSHMKVLNTDGIEKLIDRAKELEEVQKYRMDKGEMKPVGKAALS